MENDRKFMYLMVFLAVQSLIISVVAIQQYSINGKVESITGNVIAHPNLAENLVEKKIEPTINLKIGNDPVKGDKNAPITIIEFSDFECPFCSRFNLQTLPQIEKEYISTGKVKLIFRNFPLTMMHPNAQIAAEAAECAHEQGKFWEFHDKIFNNQQLLSLENLKRWAGEVGLNTNKFNQCLDSGKMAKEVQKDLSEGLEYGVTGTPAFFINGKLISGALPFATFKQMLEAELAK
jgi:protein-disulfide isomerase